MNQPNEFQRKEDVSFKYVELDAPNLNKCDKLKKFEACYYLDGPMIPSSAFDDGIPH
jgi:hypothetical protein